MESLGLQPRRLVVVGYFIEYRMSYKLYTFCRSSTAWRARIALNLKHIKPQYVYVNLLKGEQKTSQYIDVNPNQGVPTL